MAREGSAASTSGTSILEYVAVIRDNKRFRILWLGEVSWGTVTKDLVSVIFNGSLGRDHPGRYVGQSRILNEYCLVLFVI